MPVYVPSPASTFPELLLGLVIFVAHPIVERTEGIRVDLDRGY
jgi:hypothetical protein